MSAFLTENPEFRKIYFHKIQETELTSEVYVLPAARKFGIPLLEAWLKKDDLTFNIIYKDTLIARETYKKSSEKSVCSFEYAILEHLIFTDKTDEMLFLIENNTFQIENDRVFVLSVGWKKYYSIIYYFVQYELATSEDKLFIESELTA